MNQWFRSSALLALGLTLTLPATGLAGSPPPMQSATGELAPVPSPISGPGEVVVSRGGATTWNNENIDTPGTIPQLSVTTVREGFTNFPLVSYYSTANAGDLKFAQIDPGTGLWTNEIAVSTADDEGNATSIAYYPFNAEYILVHHNQTTGTWEVASKVLGAGSWQNETIEATGAPGVFGRDSGCGIADVDLVVAYPDVAATGIRFASKDLFFGGPWTVVSEDVGLNYRDIELVTDGTDTHLAYIDVDNFDLHYAVRTSSGTYTKQIVQTDVGCAGCSVALALDSQGRPHIVYPSLNGAVSGLTHTWLDGGTWFREDIENGTVFNDFAYFALRIDDFDNLHLAYQNNVTGQLKYATKIDVGTLRGGGWNPQNVTAMPAGSGVQYVGMVLAGSCPRVVWGDPVAGTLDAETPAGGEKLLVPGDYSSIREAMSFACDGDSVQVGDGTYAETDNIDVYGKNLTLFSENGPELTTIDLGDRYVNLQSSVFGATVQGELSGFTITNGRGIRVNSFVGTIDDCVVHNCSSPGGLFRSSGIEVSGSSNLTVSHCVLTGNLHRGQQGAISVSGGSFVDVVSTTISGNRSVNGNLNAGGLYISGSSTVTLDRSIVWGNCGEGASEEIRVISGSLTINDSVVRSSEASGAITYTGDNVFTDPLFCAPEDCGNAPTAGGTYSLTSLSPALAANHPSGQLVGALPQGCTFAVRLDVDGSDAPASETQDLFARLTDPGMTGDFGNGAFTPTGTDKGVTVTVTGGDQYRDRGTPPGPQTFPELVRDFIGVDAAGAEVTVSIAGLAAGAWQVTSYHLDWFVWSNSNFFDIEVDDAAGTGRLVVDDGTFPQSADHLGETFVVYSNGTDDVDLRIQEDSATNRVRFNGITIEPASVSSAIAYAGTGDNVSNWRTTTVSKANDLDGDNVYGTEGWVLYGIDDPPGASSQGIFGSVDPLTFSAGGFETISSLPPYLTVTNNGQNTIFAGFGYPTLDDPRVPPGSGLPIVETGLGGVNFILNGSETAVCDITITGAFPASGIRVGVIGGRGGDLMGSYRLAQTAGSGSGSAVAIPAGPATSDLTIYFFDIVEALPGDVFTLFLTQDAVGNPNVAYVGLTFDGPIATSVEPIAGMWAPQALQQNYPNPFAVSTTIQYEIPRRELVDLRVFDVGGREVRVLESSVKATGRHSVVWDGRNGAGARVPNGIYFYRLQTGEIEETRKILHLR